MEANKHAGRLVGQSPVYICNNEQHVLVEIGDVVLPSKVISGKSKVLPFHNNLSFVISTSIKLLVGIRGIKLNMNSD